MAKLQEMIDAGVLAYNDEGARECGLLAMFDPAEDIALFLDGDDVMQIDQSDDGSVLILTSTFGDIEEHRVNDPDTDLNVDIYKRVYL